MPEARRAPTRAMWRERTGWAGVFGAALVTATVGCAGDGSGLEQSAEAIALAPTALVEPGIAESVQIGVRAGVSFSGGPGGWLAVWASPLWDNSPAVMAARIGATSVPLDRPAFTLTPMPDNGGYVGLGAALGDRWLTWNGSDGRLATVPTAGTPVVTRLSAQPCQNLVCDAAGCLCTSRGSSERLIAQRLDAAGAPSGAAIFLGPSAFGTPAIAATATQWLTVFESTHPDTGAIDLRINRMLRDGTVRDGQGVPFTTIAAGRVQPAVATDGTAFLVVFVATAGSGSRLPGIYAQRVEASTNIVAGPPVLLVSGTDVASPSVAWDGARYWVAWQRLPGAPGQYTRIGADGALVDATPRVLGSTSSRVFRPKVAVSAGRVAMLWQEGDLGAAWFQRFRADGTAESAATPISYQAPRWAQPALASNGSRFALSCYTPDGAAPRTRAWLIGADGALNSASGVGYNDLPPTSLFWDGARFRGFSTASGGLGARTVPSTHVTLSAAGDAFTTAALPALSDRGFYGPRPSQAALVGGVAFVDTSSSGVFGLSRLDAASARLDPLPIAFGGSNEYGRAFGTDGTVLLGVWDASETSLRGARISRDGDILDAASWNLSYTPPGGAPEPFTPIAIAHGAGVWSVLGSSGFVGGSFRLRVRQVNASGTLLRSIALPATALPIYASMYRRYGSAILWNGQEFVVAALTAPAGASGFTGELRVWSVRADGTVSPPDGLLLDPAFSFQGAGSYDILALAALSNGTTGVAWVQTDFQRATRRCVVRMLQPGMGVDAGAPVDAGSDAAIDRPDVTVVDVRTDLGTDLGTDSGTDVPVIAVDVPVIAVDVPPMIDAGGAPDVAVIPDVVAVDVSADDAGTPMDVTIAVDAPSATDTPGPSDRPVAADVPAADVPAADVPATAPPPPEDDGGCDVGGVAGARSRSPLFASVSFLALALTARRRRSRRAALISSSA